ncbi:ferredoxin:thioredoxin reductase [Patescibacteria group bacterium]|nr:ferredoxin:thioredoxin reductase [Patescibacteria group bacterium]
MTEEQEKLIKIWEEFTAKQTDFQLNPDMEIVKKVAQGVLDNQKKHNLLYCPCRLPTGDQEKDYGLICPCNFKIQDNWEKRGDCWCSLFIKK